MLRELGGSQISEGFVEPPLLNSPVLFECSLRTLYASLVQMRTTVANNVGDSRLDTDILKNGIRASLGGGTVVVASL